MYLERMEGLFATAQDEDPREHVIEETEDGDVVVEDSDEDDDEDEDDDDDDDEDIDEELIEEDDPS